MCYTGIRVQSNIPLSPQWSRRHGERPHTRHSLFYSFTQRVPVLYVPGERSGHGTWRLHTTPATVIHSVPRDHTIKCTKNQQDMHDPRTGTAASGPTCAGHPPTSFLFFLCFPCHRRFSGMQQNLGFYTSKGSPVYFGFEIPGRSFFHGHEQVRFLSRMYLNRFVKTFLFTKDV